MSGHTLEAMLAKRPRAFLPDHRNRKGDSMAKYSMDIVTMVNRTIEIKSMECLKKLGADLDKRSCNGMTALDLAIQFNENTVAE